MSMKTLTGLALVAVAASTSTTAAETSAPVAAPVAAPLARAPIRTAGPLYGGLARAPIRTAAPLYGGARVGAAAPIRSSTYSRSGIATNPALYASLLSGSGNDAFVRAAALSGTAGIGSQDPYLTYSLLNGNIGSNEYLNYNLAGKGSYLNNPLVLSNILSGDSDSDFYKYQLINQGVGRQNPYLTYSLFNNGNNGAIDFADFALLTSGQFGTSSPFLQYQLLNGQVSQDQYLRYNIASQSGMGNLAPFLLAGDDANNNDFLKYSLVANGELGRNPLVAASLFNNGGSLANNDLLLYSTLLQGGGLFGGYYYGY